MIRQYIAALFVALACTGAHAQQDFPNKRITIVIGVSPGGTLDTLARVLAQGMQTTLKQPVIVENVTGAGGLIGGQRLVKADPDGYTLGFSNLSLLIIPHLYPKSGFKPMDDLVPVASIANVPMVFSVSNASGIKDLKGLIDYMRAHPGKANFGSGGPGTTAHLAEAMFLTQAKVDGVLVQYRGTGPALVDLMAGTMDGVIDQTVTMLPLYGEKRARAIAVSAPQRIPQMPDVPTFAEAGLPQFDMTLWNGVVAPKGTPRAVIDKLAAVISQVMESQDYKDRVEKQFASAIPSAADRGPDAFRKVLERDNAKVAALVKAIGLQPAP